MTARPVMRAMRKSSTSRNWSAAAQTSGSCSRSQSSLGSVLMVWMGMPVRSNRASAPKRSRSHSFCASVRVSMPRIVGRSGRPDASTGVTASPCTDRPIAATSRTPAAAIASRHRLERQPPDRLEVLLGPARCGKSTRYSRLALASSAPSMSKTTALQPVVPTSRPIRFVIERVTLPCPGIGSVVDRGSPCLSAVTTHVGRPPSRGSSRAPRPRRPRCARGSWRSGARSRPCR